MEIVRNVFHHKVALVNSQDFIERKWQKQFDEALIGSYSTHTRKASTSAAVKKDSEFLKYSIFTLSRS
jgi:NADH:ubiquinone oxidoreductase subunit